uniref:NADH dehydrogenase [ubiquinone] 1 alpha subcomplex subunit 11 n=1 Tax=Mus spicilegus TaxID=10103 RepID=A0A8C6IG70_MUSSI
MVKRFFESYHEVPDGTQCHRKTYITTALGGICGIIGSAYSVSLNPADSTLEAVARVGRYTFTAAAIGERSEDQDFKVDKLRWISRLMVETEHQLLKAVLCPLQAWMAWHIYHTHTHTHSE